MARPFHDRADAGRVLATQLTAYSQHPQVQVLALPRGGVPVAFEVAQALRAPLDVFLVRKLGVPGHEELAMGAVATGGVRVLNDEVIRALAISPDVIETITAAEQQELARREHVYRGERPPLEMSGRIVILVDDGLATGATMRAVVAALRQQQPARLIIAVPIAAVETCEALRAEVDEIICVVTPRSFYGVGQGYDDFSQMTDAEVRDLLRRADCLPPASHGV
jgi:putative phosphoribosyl transferase